MGRVRGVRRNVGGKGLDMSASWIGGVRKRRIGGMETMGMGMDVIRRCGGRASGFRASSVDAGACRIYCNGIVLASIADVAAGDIESS